MACYTSTPQDPSDGGTTAVVAHRKAAGPCHDEPASMAEYFPEYCCAQPVRELQVPRRRARRIWLAPTYLSQKSFLTKWLPGVPPLGAPPGPKKFPSRPPPHDQLRLLIQRSE